MTQSSFASTFPFPRRGANKSPGGAFCSLLFKAASGYDNRITHRTAAVRSPFPDSTDPAETFSMAAKTSFKQQCPSCETMVPIKDGSLIGKKIDCPKCKYRFVVEEPADEV